MGLWVFYLGFRDFRNKRHIQNIPTSKIATGAVGSFVEIKGKLLSGNDDLVKAPLSGTPCVLYYLYIHRHKYIFYHIYSKEYFHLDDGSGATALVQIKDAQFKVKGRSTERSNLFKRGDNISPYLKQALIESGYKYLWEGRGGIESSSEYHDFKEWYLLPGDNLYVMGYSSPALKLEANPKDKFKNIWKAKKMVQALSYLRKRFDINQDGSLDPIELEKGAEIYASELESSNEKSKEKYFSKEKKYLPNTKMTIKKKKGFPFVISNLKEDDLAVSISWDSFLKIVGGPIIAVTGFVWFLLVVHVI